MESFIILWLLFGIIAAVIASNRGGSGFMWFIGGLLFGPLAILFAFAVGQRCNKCGMKIPSKAKVCPYCGVKFVSRKEFDRIQAEKRRRQAAPAPKLPAEQQEVERV